jgi:hypothetical protein
MIKRILFVLIAISVGANIASVFADTSGNEVTKVYVATRPGVSGHVAYEGLEERFVTKNPNGDNLYLLFPDHRVYVKRVYRIIKENGEYVVSTPQGHLKYEKMIGFALSDTTTVSGAWVYQ